MKVLKVLRNFNDSNNRKVIKIKSRRKYFYFVKMLKVLWNFNDSNNRKVIKNQVKRETFLFCEDVESTLEF